MCLFASAVRTRPLLAFARSTAHSAGAVHGRFEDLPRGCISGCDRIVRRRVSAEFQATVSAEAWVR